MDFPIFVDIIEIGSLLVLLREGVIFFPITCMTLVLGKCQVLVKFNEFYSVYFEVCLARIER